MARATIDEVAKAAGVGRSTVSRVLNGSPSVSPSARESVQKAIAEMNYSPSRAARSLVMRRSHALGLIIPEELDRFFGDPFFAEVMSGVTRRVLESEYALNVMVASGPPDGAAANKVASFVLNGGVDGVIVVAHHANDTFLNRIVESVPMVFGGRPIPFDSIQGTYFVDAENEQGSYGITRHLIERGCTRIAAVTGPQNMGAAQDRLKGFNTAMAEAGLIPVATIEGDYSGARGVAAAKELLDGGVDFDGVVAANDLMGAAVVRTLLQAGLRVPEDVAVVGFDDAKAAVEVTPALTTVRQPIRIQGEVMADVLLRALAGESPPSVTIMPTEIVVRQSA